MDNHSYVVNLDTQIVSSISVKQVHLKDVEIALERNILGFSVEKKSTKFAVQTSFLWSRESIFLFPS